MFKLNKENLLEAIRFATDVIDLRFYYHFVDKEYKDEIIEQYIDCFIDELSVLESDTIHVDNEKALLAAWKDTIRVLDVMLKSLMRKIEEHPVAPYRNLHIGIRLIMEEFGFKETSFIRCGKERFTKEIRNRISSDEFSRVDFMHKKGSNVNRNRLSRIYGTNPWIGEWENENGSAQKCIIGADLEIFI